MDGVNEFPRQIGNEAARLDAPQCPAGLRINLEQDGLDLLRDVNLPRIPDVFRVGGRGVDDTTFPCRRKTNRRRRRTAGASARCPSPVKRRQHRLVKDVKRVAVLDARAVAKWRGFSVRGAVATGDVVSQRGLPEFFVGLVEDDDGFAGGEHVHRFQREQRGRPGDLTGPIGGTG